MPAPGAGAVTVIVPVGTAQVGWIVTLAVGDALTVTCDVAVPLHGAVPKL